MFFILSDTGEPIEYHLLSYSSMKVRIYLFAFILIIVVFCSKRSHSPKEALSFSDFANNLSFEMSYHSIVATFGEPSMDLGSGIHIYVYQLVDSTELWIGYANKVLYAIHMDKNQQIIDSLTRSVRSDL